MVYFALGPDTARLCPDALTQRLFSHCARPLRFATHNWHSLSSNIKLEQLVLDFEHYKLDFLILQDTQKKADPRLARMAQYSATLHTLTGGIAFIVGPKLQPYLESLKSISHLPICKKDLHCHCLQTYNLQCMTDPILHENLFQQLEAAVQISRMTK